ncbi:hypothetical protein QTO34_017952 [Cnephaeus nilssonii]|uniref:L1 transposable element RRM domain-containing protein n=1 Tax=Cnephaeus nilssonii TaxID=3371016 RepID=A0AA40LRP1_CNENI|nr:hypothetical protein QTO34_017952 [Eptesicus nilssonii]
MRRQRNMSRMKEMEESKLLDIEFKTTFKRLLKNLLKTSEELSETFKDLNENAKRMEKDQSEIKHTLSEIKNIQKFNSRSKDPKNQTKDLKHEETKNTQLEKQKEKRIQKYEESVKSLWNNFKRTNIRIIGVPEEEREQNIENLFEELMIENFPYLVKEIDLQVQAAHRTPNKRNPKRTTPRHIIIKMPRAKDKERILKAAREKQLVTYKGVPIRLSPDFSTETMQARREWQEIFKMMNSKNLQPRLLYPAKLSFRNEGQIKSFTDKKKIKEFITTKPGLYEMPFESLRRAEAFEMRCTSGQTASSGAAEALCRSGQTASSPALAFYRRGAGWLSVRWCTRPLESLQRSHGADAELAAPQLSVLLAQSATLATLSPAPCASRWPNRAKRPGAGRLRRCHGDDAGSLHRPSSSGPLGSVRRRKDSSGAGAKAERGLWLERRRGRARDMVGVGCGKMVEQVSGGARPRRGAGSCHRGEPLKIICSCMPRFRPALAPAASTGPACSHCRHWNCRLHLLPAPGASPNCPSELLHLPLLLKGNRGQQPPLTSAASDGPASTCS